MLAWKTNFMFFNYLFYFILQLPRFVIVFLWIDGNKIYVYQDKTANSNYFFSQRQKETADKKLRKPSNTFCLFKKDWVENDAKDFEHCVALRWSKKGLFRLTDFYDPGIWKKSLNASLYLPPYESGGSNSPILRLDEKEFPRRKMRESKWNRLLEGTKNAGIKCIKEIER